MYKHKKYRIKCFMLLKNNNFALTSKGFKIERRINTAKDELKSTRILVFVLAEIKIYNIQCKALYLVIII